MIIRPENKLRSAAFFSSSTRSVPLSGSLSSFRLFLFGVVSFLLQKSCPKNALLGSDGPVANELTTTQTENGLAGSSRSRSERRWCTTIKGYSRPNRQAQSGTAINNDRGCSSTGCSVCLPDCWWSRHAFSWDSWNRLRPDWKVPPRPMLDWKLALGSGPDRGRSRDWRRNNCCGRRACETAPCSPDESEHAAVPSSPGSRVDWWAVAAGPCQLAAPVGPRLAVSSQAHRTQASVLTLDAQASTHYGPTGSYLGR